MKVLVVTNITPDAATPARGNFVRSQVDALRAEGVDAELLAFPTGRWALARSVAQIRRRLHGAGYDLVHAHYGLAGWSAALAGASPLVVTFHGTDVRHRVVGPLSRRLLGRVDLVAAVSRALFASEAGRPGLPPDPPGAVAVLPMGADLSLFAPAPSTAARERLGLDPDGRYLLFPASPSRPEKRHDLAREVARRAGAELLTLGHVEAERVPDWVNASSAVLVTSDNEGFGLAAVEALACNVPVLSRPVGIAPLLLRGLEGCLVAPFEPEAWSRLAARHLETGDPRVEGRERASWFRTPTMARRVLRAYEDVLAMAAPDLPLDLS